MKWSEFKWQSVIISATAFSRIFLREYIYGRPIFLRDDRASHLHIIFVIILTDIIIIAITLKTLNSLF